MPFNFAIINGKASLRTLLIVPFMVQIFLAVGLTGGLSFINGQEAVNELARSLRSEVTERIQERMEVYLSIPHRVNQLNANAIALGELSLNPSQRREQHFWQQIKTFDLISHNYMGTPAGDYFGAKRLQNDTFQIMTRNQNGDNQYFATDAQGLPTTLQKEAKNYDPRVRPWYQAAVKAGQPTWSDIYPDFTTKGLAITAVYPQYHTTEKGDKKLKGVLGASFIFTWMNDFLGNLKIGEHGQTFIIERTGLLVANSVHAPVLDERLNRIYAEESDSLLVRKTTEHIKTRFRDLAQIKSSQQLDFNIEGQRQFLQITPFHDQWGLDWLIVVVAPEADFMGQIHAIMSTTLWLSAIALCLGLIGGLLTSRWVIKPIQNLNKAAKALARGEWQQSVDAQRKDELGELAKSFNSMTEQLKESFNALETKNADLRKLDKLKDEFLANTSHELRTPLNGIIGIAESMCDGAVGPLSNGQRKNLLMVAQSGHRLTNLVNDILDFSKLKHKNIELHLLPVGLREITEVVLPLHKNIIGQTEDKKLKLINKIPENFPPAKADENRLQQILHNIIGNAVKFTEQGKIEISAHFIAEDVGFVDLKIKDTGIGIPADKIDCIFESFEQLDGSSARQQGGTGLGLTVTKQLVELHGGKIFVESIVGEGSTFTIRLPVAKEAAGPAEPLSRRLSRGYEQSHATHELIPAEPDLPADKTKSKQGERFTILIVDDEPINLQVLVNHLSLQKYAVVEALNGIDALELVNDGLRPDLVLLDVMMPKMTGYEVCRQLRETFPANELPILLLTAKNQTSSLVEGLDAGANDYLTKPISKNELLARIQTHIQLSKINLAYGRFVPHEFIQLLDKDSVVDLALGDHVEKEMSILFSDIRGFTSISEAMSPQENFDFINAYLSRMEPIIAKHRGFIDKYIGDAIMALFPTGVEQAVQAAIQMLQRLTEYNETRGRPGRPTLRIGIGIHTGVLMLGTVGGENRMDGTVIADAVNLASRTEGLTKTYGAALLITEQVYDKLNDPKQYKIRVIDHVRVKGKTNAVTVLEVFDADSAEQVQLKLNSLHDFETGCRCYQVHDIKQAHDYFSRVLTANPEDKAAQVYLERCEADENIATAEK